jgi:hypothetical protein
MFTIKAGYSDNFEVQTSAEKVREFFADIRNFADLMPGIASIHTDAKGVAHWKIEATIPLVGQIMQKFAIELAEDSSERDRMVSLFRSRHRIFSASRRTSSRRQRERHADPFLTHGRAQCAKVGGVSCTISRACGRSPDKQRADQRGQRDDQSFHSESERELEK